MANFWFKTWVEGGDIVIVSQYCTTNGGFIPHSLGLHRWHIKSQVKYPSRRNLVFFDKAYRTVVMKAAGKLVF